MQGESPRAGVPKGRALLLTWVAQCASRGEDSLRGESTCAGVPRGSAMMTWVTQIAGKEGRSAWKMGMTCHYPVCSLGRRWGGTCGGKTGHRSAVCLPERPRLCGGERGTTRARASSPWGDGTFWWPGPCRVARRTIMLAQEDT